MLKEHQRMLKASLNQSYGRYCWTRYAFNRHMYMSLKRKSRIYSVITIRTFWWCTGPSTRNHDRSPISAVRLALRLVYSSRVWAAGLMCSPPPLGLAKWALMEEALLCWWASNGDGGSTTAPFSTILWDSTELDYCSGRRIGCLGQKNVIAGFCFGTLCGFHCSVMHYLYSRHIENEAVRAELCGNEVTLCW